MFSLPKCIEAARKAYVGDMQHPSETSSVDQGPPMYRQLHIASSRSSSSTEVASSELNASSPPSSPLSNPPSSPAKPLHPRLRTDSVQDESTASSSSSKSQSLRSPKAIIDNAEFLPPGFEALPECCYNYQSYIPPPPPDVLPWSRRQLYTTIVNICPPMFLSCNWTNPVHLASIISPGSKWATIEIIAENMTPAVNWEFDEDLRAWKRVEGMLVNGLEPKLMEELEGCLKSKYRTKYERRVEEVAVELDDGDVVDVAAYVYQKA